MRFSQNDSWKNIDGSIDLKNLNYSDVNIKYGDKLFLQGAFLFDKGNRVFAVHKIIKSDKP